MMTSSRSSIRVSILLLACLGFFDQCAQSQQFSFSEKGKKQPATVCYATLDHFDGVTLWLKPSNPADGSPLCSVQSPSSQNWQIHVQLSVDPSVFQGVGGGFPNSNPFRLGGPSVVNPGRMASSISEETRDVDLQRRDFQDQQRQAANQQSQPQNVSPPDVDLTTCKKRGTDSIETTINGSVLPVSGTISNISGGWVYLQKNGQATPQRYRLLDIISITIGSC
jgi:hypothetical protein